MDSNSINPGIPYLLGFVIQSDSHIKDNFRTETPDEWKIEETYDTTMYEIIVLIKTSSFLCVFPPYNLYCLH